MNTNSSSPTEAGQNCHRTKFVWDGNGSNFAQAIVKNAMKVNGNNWVLVTNDYVWGHDTSKATRQLVEAQGGKIIGEILVPQNTRDFTSYLLRLQQLKPDVVAAAVGGDDQKSMRQQVIQAGLHKRMAWINNQQDWPDVYGLGPDAMFGVFGTTWYYRLDLPGVKEFVAQYQKTFPGMAIRVPGNVYYNGYMATRELLRACERAGSTNNIAVIKQLENLKVSARDRMQHFDAYMNPATHQMQQTIYMASYNDTPGREGRHLQDHVVGAAGRRRRQGGGRRVQARVVRVHAVLRAIAPTPCRLHSAVAGRQAGAPDHDAPRSHRIWSTASRSDCCSRCWRSASC